MSYIGRGLQSGAFRQLDDISSGFDGSDTTHTMQVNSTNVTVGDVNQILLSLGGVIQKPGTDFTVSSSVLTFTTAPAANTSFFAILLGSDNGGTTTPTDGSVTTSKFASGVAIGATGTANTLAGIPFFSDSSNSSMYTHDVSGTDDTAQYNTAFGFNALDAITTGDKHVAIGYNAGTAVTEAVGNVLIGEAAGAALTTGGSNTLIGRLAGDAFDTEANNIAIGVTALSGAVAGGEYNVGIGNYSLLALTSADYVTAVGNNAGTAITTGGKHVLIGHNAGSGLTTSSGSCVYIGTGAGSGAGNDTETNNIGIGEDTIGAAGNTINGAEYNIAIGNLALDALTSGDDNVAIGYRAGSAITAGASNVILGKDAGEKLVDGNSNTFLGHNAGNSITTGGGNVFIGSGSGDSHDTESHNIAIGLDTLRASVAGGEYNCLVGNYTGYDLTSGDANVAMGYQAGASITTGLENVVLGMVAGNSNSSGVGVNVLSGQRNILIGSYINTAASDTNHGIGLGYAFAVAANDFSFGKASNVVTNDFDADADWSRSSDVRLKRNIEDTTLGLDFINDLRPVKFQWKPSNEVPEIMTSEYNEKNQKNLDYISHGFIAQEVKEVIDKHGDQTFGGWHLDKNDNETQRIKKNMFIMPLIKAVQELSTEVKQLKEKLKEDK